MPARNVTLTANFECQLPEAPEAKKATGIDTDTFTANWEAVPGAVTYTLDVALDDGFADFVPGYENYEVVGNTSHTLVGLASGTIYHYRVKATNDCGTSEYSNTVRVTTDLLPFTDDRDGNTCRVVRFGDQVWMAENLKWLPATGGIVVSWQWSGSKTEKYYYVYGFDKNGTAEEAKATDNYQHYGVLYNWPAVMAGVSTSSSNPSGVQGVCPPGWHVPSDDEWTQLTNYLIGNYVDITSDNVGNALKSCRQVYSQEGGECDTDDHPRWDSDFTHYGTDEFGFSALPGGTRGSFQPPFA